MRKKLKIIGIIFITLACIYLGLQTRKQSAILVTQIPTKSAGTLSYMVETKNHQIIMIDGGDALESETLEKYLQEKGGVVEAWFITGDRLQNFGALQKIFANNTIEVKHIYVGFSSSDWHKSEEAEAETTEFLQTIFEKQPVTQISEDLEVLIDQLYVKAMCVTNPEEGNSKREENQGLIVKINNTYKSMIFMGNMASEGAKKFKDNHLDEIDCDAVQVSNRTDDLVKEEIYQKMSPQYLFMSVPKDTDKTVAERYLQNLKQATNAQETYVSETEGRTVKIW